MAAKDWIKGAVKKPRSFSAAAKHAGKATAESAEETDDAPGKRARLAATLMKLRKK
jgi:hypothetical protein